MASAEEYADRASTLLLLKDSLEDMYAEQKEILLEEVYALPTKDAGVILNKLVQINFITKEELKNALQKIFQKPAAPITQNKVEKKEEEQAKPDVNDNFEEKDNLESEIPRLVLFSKVPKSELEELIVKLKNFDVFTIKDLLQLHENDKLYNTVEEIIPQDKKTFESLVNYLISTPKFAPKKPENNVQNINNNNLSQLKSLGDEGNGTMYEYWDNLSHLMVIPLNRKPYYFLTIDQGSSEEAANEKTQIIYFYLDISTSMNHDQQGKYYPPESLDGAVSSIKKARSLIRKLAVASILKGAIIRIVLWNEEIHKCLSISPDEFIDEKTGLLVDVKKIEEIVTTKTSESVFRAQGSTNIEEALSHLRKSILSDIGRADSITVWFLTDGEETSLRSDNGSIEGIPYSLKSRHYDFYNSPQDNGLTLYQQKMVNIFSSFSLDTAEYSCKMEFHILHMGEAHPIFLNCLRQMVNGHFHAVSDLAKLENEIHLSSVNFDSEVSISSGDLKYLSMSAFSEGSVYSRGVLPLDLYHKITSTRTVTVKSRKLISNLTNHHEKEVPQILSESIFQVMGFESSMSDLINSLKDDLSVSNISKVCFRLNEIRKEKFEVLQALAKYIKAGTVLQFYLEKVLESLEVQMDALTRFLDEIQSKEAEKYDKNSVQKNALFNAKEKMAIEAGLESMKVQLGTGFVSQSNLDRQIQKNVSVNGPRARKMLNRVCLLAQTEVEEKSETLLTLIILEGAEYAQALSKITEQLCSQHNVHSIHDLQETLSHKNKSYQYSLVKASEVDPNQQQDKNERTFNHYSHGNLRNLTSTFTYKLTPNSQPLTAQFATKEVYPQILISYTTRVNSNDLQEACNTMLDPLSFSSFLDLIKESNTLPALLYTISANQSIGVLFHSKESLYVRKGGVDMVSFDYFRLYWKLAKKDEETKEITVPGCFSKANCAIPLAPEPMTNLILCNLMQGLIGECISGTPMAILSSIGNIYIGFILSHLFKSPMKPLDITRVAQFLATYACWIDNPATSPIWENVTSLITSMIDNCGVNTEDSPGKIIPLKAYVLSMFRSEETRVDLLYNALQTEIFSRSLKQILIAGQNDPKFLSSPHDVQQYMIRKPELMLSLIKAFSDSTIIDEFGAPTDEIRISDTLYSLYLSKSEDEVIKFLMTDKNFLIAINWLSNLFCNTLNSGFSKSIKWNTIQKLLSYWFVITTSNLSEMRRNFAEFKPPTAFESHFNNHLISIEQSDLFESSALIWSFVHPEVQKIVYINSSITRDAVDEITLRYIAKLFLKVISVYKWTSISSSGHGTFEVDYAVVRAIRDETYVAHLNETQISIYKAANVKGNSNKGKRYQSYVAPKPQRMTLKDENNVQIRGKSGESVKPILHIGVMGPYSSGKSTLIGRLLSDLGTFPSQGIHKIREAAMTMTKSNFYPWLVDTLKYEREEGKTVEFGIVRAECSQVELKIVDLPGSKKHLRHFLYGLSIVDYAIVVISATPGEYEASMLSGVETKSNYSLGSLRQQLVALSAYGVKNLIVVITKMKELHYDQNRFEYIKSEFSVALKKYGFAHNRVPFIPVACLDGVNILNVRGDQNNNNNNGSNDAIEHIPWYDGWEYTNQQGDTFKGKTLMEVLNSLAPIPRIESPNLLASIIDSSRVPGVGTISTVKVLRGTLHKGDKLTLSGKNASVPVDCSISSMEIHNIVTDVCHVGHLVGVKIAKVDRHLTSRGHIISNLGSNFEPVLEFTAQLLIMDDISLREKSVFECYSGSSRSVVKIDQLISLIDKKTGMVIEESPKFARKNSMVLCRIISDRPMCVMPFKEFPPLGRLIFRVSLEICAVGVIKEVSKIKPVNKPAVRVIPAKSKYFR